MHAVTTLRPGLRRLTAANPSPMTFEGTNSYLIGEADVIVVDPGPDDARHKAALRAAIGLGRVQAILVTHAHLDHSAGAEALAKAVDAPVMAFGAATAGRSPLMAELAARPGLQGGEGLDLAFAPDRKLSDGARLETELGPLEALHTPGHLSSHMCFALPETGAILTGDTVMGWSTTLISPPDGSVSAFLASLDRLTARPERLYLPGHGPVVEEGAALAVEQKAHRLAREEQILAALEEGAATPQALTRRIYAEVPRHLHPAAARNVLAHLIDLAERGEVELPEGPLAEATYRLR